MKTFFNMRDFRLNFSKVLILMIITLISSYPLSAINIGEKTYITTEKNQNCFTISASGKSAPIISCSDDFPGVLRIMKLFQNDIANVTNAKPEVFILNSEKDKIPGSKELIIIGTIGKSFLIDKLIKDKKLDINNIKGKWETFLIQEIKKPLPNVENALVIAGSDKRGTIYGMLDLSSKIGVSPWYWWADVPVKKHNELYVLPGRHSNDGPKIKYRGIFLNDEAPALEGWAYEKFGGLNHKFYEKVFELILRMKGNFLWPAMWGKAFNDDDSLNQKLADEYGVVMSTSHHEPMMRSQDEWRRYGNGPWDYSKNEEKLREFWRKGIERMGNYESIITLAMRGDGDVAMSKDANIGLLEKIVKDQRQIIGEVTGKDVTTVPQVWALYKEVQEYYDKGMRVPDDVTLLLCDDNWGNVRKLPNLTDKPRKGGYGMYYHFDFVGGPRNYKWINTNQIERVWEQMHLSYEYGVKQIWLVNVGDLKPMEFPIEFFLDYAWNPEKIPSDSLPAYTKHWAEEQFGTDHSGDVAGIISAYTKYNSRRKPELLSPDSYSLTNYREAESVVSDYNKLADKAEHIYNSIPAAYKDAYFQLVLHPVIASSNLYSLYFAASKNHLYALQGRAATNSLAEQVRNLYIKDSLISVRYNKIVSNGKWNHMMDQTHIGYTYWQQPDHNSMPQLNIITIPESSEMGVSIEGSDKWWASGSNEEAVLPEFDPFNKQTYYVEIFNRGKLPFEYFVSVKEPWIKIDNKYGTIDTEKRLFIGIDWKSAPSGKSKIPITITGTDKSVIIYAVINNPVSPKPEELTGYIEANGYVSIEADHYSQAVTSNEISWLKIPNLGRTGSSETMIPVTAKSQIPGGNTPHLEYKVYFYKEGDVKVNTYLSPTLNFNNGEGLRYAVSFDDEKPQILNMHAGDSIPDWKYPQWWNNAVSENCIIISSNHSLKKAGEHIIKFWAVDPGVVLQKIVIDTGNLKPSYLGPGESYFGKPKLKPVVNN